MAVGSGFSKPTREGEKTTVEGRTPFRERVDTRLERPAAMRPSLDQVLVLERAQGGGKGRRAYSRECPLDRSEPKRSVRPEEGNDANRPLLPDHVDHAGGRARALEGT